MSPQRITQRHDAAFRRREFDLTELSERVPQRDDTPEHLRANAESLLIALRRTDRRERRVCMIAACVLFAAFAWIGIAWLTRHFLP